MNVYRVFRPNGDLAQVALSASQAIELCPESRRRGWRVLAFDEEVPQATGLVRDWDRGGGCGGRKLHWQCPICGQEHWSDFDPLAVSNPVLWLCEGGGGAVCLIHWSHEAPEAYGLPPPTLP